MQTTHLKPGLKFHCAENGTPATEETSTPLKDRQILLIDDDPNMLNLLTVVLNQAGAVAYQTESGTAGLAMFERVSPDLVVMDVMLPDMRGWMLCQRIRQISAVPIVMLTGLSQDVHIIKGLAHGADDYLIKTTPYEVLLARMGALLRRATPSNSRHSSDSYEDDYLKIDLEARVVMVAGQEIKVSDQEFDLLAYLIRRPGQLCSFQQILADVWGTFTTGNPQYVHLSVFRLRHKLGLTAHSHDYLQTERAVGYRFVPLSDGVGLKRF